MQKSRAPEAVALVFSSCWLRVGTWLSYLQIEIMATMRMDSSNGRPKLQILLNELFGCFVVNTRYDRIPLDDLDEDLEEKKKLLKSHSRYFILSKQIKKKTKVNQSDKICNVFLNARPVANHLELYRLFYNRLNSQISTG